MLVCYCTASSVVASVASSSPSSPRCPNCNDEVVQNTTGRPRRFCSRDCTNAYYNARKTKGNGKRKAEQHSLAQIDVEARTAVCAICGPGAKIWKGGKGRERWRCAARVRAQVSRAWQRDPDLERERKWASRGVVGMTVARFEEMLVEQEGKCALCTAPVERAVVDHNHTTGEVRALLCTTCNTGLGKFGDDPDRLDAAATYLRSYITIERQMAARPMRRLAQEENP